MSSGILLGQSYVAIDTRVTSWLAWRLSIRGDGPAWNW
jgi:hypothetical protein